MSASAHVVLGQFGLLLNAVCKFAVVCLFLRTRLPVTQVRVFCEHDNYVHLFSCFGVLLPALTCTCASESVYWAISSMRIRINVSYCVLLFRVYHFRNWSFPIRMFRSLHVTFAWTFVNIIVISQMCDDHSF